MSKAAAVSAYQDSIYNAVQYDAERRIGERSLPIVGGLWPSLKLVGNALVRPLKVGGALMFSSDTSTREFPAMPAVPEAFKGSTLEQSFNDSWKLKEEGAKARIEAVGKLLNFDVSGWWQKSSVASHVETRDNYVVFAEDGVAANAAQQGTFVGAVLSGRGGDGGVSR